MDPPEARDEMRAFHNQAMQVEIGEAGVELGFGMAGEIGLPVGFVVAARDAAEEGEARAGERLVEPGGAVEEQGGTGFVRQILRMLGQVGEQQQRRAVLGSGEEDERGIGPAVRHGCGKHRAVEGCQELAGEGGGVGHRVSLARKALGREIGAGNAWACRAQHLTFPLLNAMGPFLSAHGQRGDFWQ